MIGYFELGFADRVENIPALAKYETPPRDHFTADRLNASIHLANERFRQDEEVDGIATSAVAVHAVDGRATIVTTGPSADALHIRAGRVQWSRRSARSAVDQEHVEWIGRSAAINPNVTELALEEGDVIALGLVDDGLTRIFEEDGARFDHAIARCIAESPIPGLRCLIGRWIA